MIIRFENVYELIIISHSFRRGREIEANGVMSLHLKKNEVIIHYMPQSSHARSIDTKLIQPRLGLGGKDDELVSSSILVVSLKD